MKHDKSFVATCFAASLLLCLATTCGCASSTPRGEPANNPAANDSEAEIEQLPAQSEYVLPDPASRGRVRVQVPEGYACSEYMEDMEPYTGKEVELEAMLVDLGEAGSLQILLDDAGFFDWWFSGSIYGTSTVAEYVDTANEAYSSSWPISVDGHDGIVLIQGSADEGGEKSGQAFVFLDEATIAFSLIMPASEAPSANAYSQFFRSEEVVDLLGRLTISVG